MQTIRTALLSFGLSGRVFHAPFIHLHPGFELVSCWERSKKTIGESYTGVKSFQSLEEILGDDSIDLVVVNTPSYTHFEYAAKVLGAGKHAIVEKPFTANASEAEQLKALAGRAGKKLAVFQNRRWDSDFKTVRKVIDQNLLGEIVEATISYDRYNPNLSPKVHKETPSPGSGIVKDLSPHLIDQALVLFGEPETVFADIRITRAHSQVDDYFEMLLYYPQLRVRLKGGYFVREPVSSYIIHGTRGTFLKSRGDVQESQLQSGIKPDALGYGIEPVSGQGFLHTEHGGKILKEKVGTEPGNYMDFFDGVWKAIVEDKPMPVTVDDGIKVMKVIDAAVQSQQEQRVVTYR